MRKMITMAVTAALAISTLTACGKTDKSERILYKKADLSKVVDLGEYNGIKVDTSSDDFKKVYEEIVASDVEEYGFYVQKTEGKIENGDIANIDYEGKKDGVAFDGGTAQGYDLEIGSGTFIEGFEEKLIGVEIGKTVDLDLKFPENYGNEELNGAAVVFTVKVNYVKTDEARKPEDFYKDLDYKTFEEYEEKTKERAVKDYIIDKIENSSKIKEYPEDDLELLYSEMKKSIETNLKEQYGMEFADYLTQMGQTEDQFRTDSIENQIKPMMDSQMILYAILDNEGIVITKKDVDAKIQEILNEMQNSDITEEELIEYYGRFNFETIVADEKAMDFLYKNAEIS